MDKFIGFDIDRKHLNTSMSEPPGIAPEAPTASSTAGLLRQSSSVWSPAVYDGNVVTRNL